MRWTVYGWTNIVVSKKVHVLVFYPLLHLRQLYLMTDR